MQDDQFDDAAPSNPFALTTVQPAQTGAVAALQKREETEVFSMVMMAKRFPRTPLESMDRILTAFQRPSLAEVSQYQFARGGTDIVGPSIRAAEAIAQEWGNLDTGWREISRGIGADGKPFSEVQAYCVDLQNTTRKALTFIVPHWRDTKRGGYQIKDERDIYELCANQAQRRLRACIIACIPGDVIEQAMAQAAATLRAKADVSPEAQKKLLDTFAQWGVTKEHIEARIQRRLDSITPAQMVAMKRIYASLRDDMSAPGDWFDMGEQPSKGEARSLADIAARAEKKPEPSAAPATAPAAGDAPTPPTFDDLKAKLSKAKNEDAAHVHAQWITPEAFPDEAQRLALDEVYQARLAELRK